LAVTARLFSVAAVTERGLDATVLRARGITRSLPPCLFVPHSVTAWHDAAPTTTAAAATQKPTTQTQNPPPPPPQGRLAGEAVACVGVCPLDALLLDGPLDEPSAAFVAAQLAVALSHLHYLGIVYRGVCAASVVLTAAGLPQLVDFRFARRAAADAGGGRCFSLCGVPEYMAPELVVGSGHTDAVDWWALGVLVWELLCGASPFASPGDDELTIYRRIARAQLPEPMPEHLSSEAASLLRALLARDPRDRLGAGRGGNTALRAHPFFAGVDWTALSEGRAPLPLGVRDRMLSAAAAAAAAGGGGCGEEGGGEEDGVVDLAAWAAAGAAGGAGSGGAGSSRRSQEEPLWIHEF